MTPRSCRKCRERGVPRPPLCPACFIGSLAARPGERLLATVQTTIQPGAVLVQAGAPSDTPFLRLAIANEAFGCELELTPQEARSLGLALLGDTP